jgi:ATP-dependent RNA helicase SUPV3L1/SUV3
VDNNGENDDIEESVGSESDDYDEEGLINELSDVDEGLLNDSVVAETDEIGSEAARALNDRYHDPVELYRELRGSEVRSKLQHSEWDSLHEIFGFFAQSGWAANQALAIYIGKSFFPTAVSKFRDFFIEKCGIEVVQDLVRVGPTDVAVKFLFPVFVEFCIEEFPDEIKRFKSIVDTADLTKPATWFPFARAMKRKIVYHCGPTNSGKTYNALQRFMEAKNGLYCSPRRVVAMAVLDKVNE